MNNTNDVNFEDIKKLEEHGYTVFKGRELPHFFLNAINKVVEIEEGGPLPELDRSGLLNHLINFTQMIVRETQKGPRDGKIRLQRVRGEDLWG